MKSAVICFSPTGGTEKIAKLIAAELDAPIMDITVYSYDLSFGPDDMLFFCFPVYGGRIPSPMYDRLKGFSGNGAAAVPVAVFGNRAVDDALLEMSDLCKKLGFVTVGGAEMVAPHSMSPKIAADRPDARDISALKTFLRTMSHRENLVEVKMPGNYPYKKYEGVPFHPTAGFKCTGCGTCSAECPTGALDPEKPRIPDRKKCISCMRCVYVCPFENRSLLAPAKMAVNAALAASCAGRKNVKFYY